MAQTDPVVLPLITPTLKVSGSGTLTKTLCDTYDGYSEGSEGDEARHVAEKCWLFEATAKAGSTFNRLEIKSIFTYDGGSKTFTKTVASSTYKTAWYVQDATGGLDPDTDARFWLVTAGGTFRCQYALWDGSTYTDDDIIAPFYTSTFEVTAYFDSPKLLIRDASNANARLIRDTGGTNKLMHY